MGAIVKMSLAAESHPDLRDALGSYHYTFSPECLDSFAEQAKGLPVRINFDGLPVGRVLAAERTADGVELSIDTNADIAELVASPAFVAATDVVHHQRPHDAFGLTGARRVSRTFRGGHAGHAELGRGSTDRRLSGWIRRLRQVAVRVAHSSSSHTMSRTR